MKGPPPTISPQLVVQQTIPLMLGRYELLGALARGGMATVYLARHRGEAGFQRLFAIKVLHAHLADDEEFVAMLLDEARIAARLHHPNVVPIVDLGSQDGIHYVVMEYVEGCSLGALLKKFRDQRPPRLIIAITLDVLEGLHAAHTLADDDGNPMNLVHRDVSPQNVMVGVDGTARITDFGIARAESRIMSTRPGQLKGKLAFMSPEQVKSGASIDCRSDVFATGTMLWSALTGRRLFLGESDAATMNNVLQMPIPAPSTIGFKPPAAFDQVILRGLARDLDVRFHSAQQMEEALREVALASSCLGSRREVAAWVNAAFGDELAHRRHAIGAATSDQRAVVDSTSNPVDLRALTPSGSSSGMHPAVESHSSPSPMSRTTRSQIEPQPMPPTRPKRTHVALLGASLAVAALMAIVLFAITRPSTRAAEQPVAQQSAPQAGPPAAPPVVAAQSASPSPPPAETSATSAEPAPARVYSTHRWVPKSQRSRNSDAPQPATASASAPPPPPPEPTKNPARWQKDAPTLPPE